MGTSKQEHFTKRYIELIMRTFFPVIAHHIVFSCLLLIQAHRACRLLSIVVVQRTSQRSQVASTVDWVELASGPLQSCGRETATTTQAGRGVLRRKLVQHTSNTLGSGLKSVVANRRAKLAETVECVGVAGVAWIVRC